MKKYNYTPKEEAFCLAYVEGKNQSDAYRSAGYKIDKMKASTIHRQAKHLMDKPKIQARIAELRVPIMERHGVTVDSLLVELEQARMAALGADNPQSAAAVTATMGKAKLCGLDKLITETTIKIVDDGSNQW